MGLKFREMARPYLTSFFVDDLMLFCKANNSNVRTVMDTLDRFCGVSGLKINFSKSKLFISPNMTRHEINSFTAISGMRVTNDLGIYLGAPIIHGRLKRSQFNFVIEKVQRKLVGWKAHSLSFAGRATLVQTVSSTVPNYNMQTVMIPKSVCNRLDKINRDFLWGDTIDKKRVHLVKWSKVCRPKKYGGLGIRDCSTNNRAMIAKVGWNLCSGKKSLWGTILKEKYNIPTNPKDWKMRKIASHVWRGVFKTKNLLHKGIRWNIGNGKNISIWKDWWCGKNSFLDRNIDLSGVNVNETVESLINVNSCWDLNKISNSIPTVLHSDIINTPLSCELTNEDKPSWLGKGSGKFTVSSCYNQISKEEGMDCCVGN